MPDWFVTAVDLSAFLLGKAKERATLLMAAGFRQITLYGAFDGRPYGMDVERLIAVARKA